MELTLEQLKAAGDLGFPGLLGVDVESVEDGVVQSSLALRAEHCRVRQCRMKPAALSASGFGVASVSFTSASTAAPVTGLTSS